MLIIYLIHILCKLISYELYVLAYILGRLLYKLGDHRKNYASDFYDYACWPVGLTNKVNPCRPIILMDSPGNALS